MLFFIRLFRLLTEEDTESLSVAYVVYAGCVSIFGLLDVFID